MADLWHRVDSKNNVAMADLTLTALGARISSEDARRLQKYRECWNFYEGYHWEDIGDTDKLQVTENYCRSFVNKFVSFEFGKGFGIKMIPELEDSLLPFLNSVWEDNNKQTLCDELGQTKAVTGDAWIQVAYIPKYLDGGVPNPEFDDPFDEYEKGRIRLLVVQPNIVFPEYADSYDKDKMTSLTVMYPVKRYPNEPSSTEMVIYKQVWTKDRCDEYLGQDKVRTYANKYGIIPFVHIKNYGLAGRTNGVSDLEDLIPLNMELNLKKSDISEIIDYHSAPVTVVFGARIGQLEKGANKVWGGLPKDGRVENLELNSDLGASNNYINGVRQAMSEVGNVPEGALGKETSISNTSGVALQVQMMPLIERTRAKHSADAVGISKVNKIILKMGFTEGLIAKPDPSEIISDTDGNKKFTNRDIYKNDIFFEDTLPKDKLIEIQQIQLEMKLGLCDRKEAMKRLGKENINKRISDIDKDIKDYPYIYGVTLDENGNITKGVAGNKDQMNRDLNTNKAGNQAQVNPGLQNSKEKKQNTNS